eukprot:5969678-Prymnesium_polylepis.1
MTWPSSAATARCFRRTQEDSSAKLGSAQKVKASNQDHLWPNPRQVRRAVAHGSVASKHFGRTISLITSVRPCNYACAAAAASS